MHSLEAADFQVFFKSVHGYDPHAWQNRLAQQVLEHDKWPRSVDMPTGAGKTALLDIAVFVLAVRPKVFPRRVVFVVDRRIVVDQVMEHAQEIVDAITEAKSDSVLGKVGENLSELSGEKRNPLGVISLKGGVPLDKAWAQRPDQPWVITTTVDQFGSRLLFRGYGENPGMRPIHAGLCGNDCLVILDEVHLSRPFVQTLRDITADGIYHGLVSVNEESGLPRRQQVVEMTATPTLKDSTDEMSEPFTYTEDELVRDTLFSQIVNASKVLILEEAPGDDPTQPPEKVLQSLQDRAKKVLRLLGEVEPHERSVGVIVNRVRTAREIHKYLKAENYDSLLLTGRMRPLDKVTVWREVTARTRPNQPVSDHVEPGIDEQSETKKEKPTVIVATQSIEVGADVSFDALITEVSSADSLKQRLGRLDRGGDLSEKDHPPARCWVLGPKEKEMKKLEKTPDFVYGKALRATWKYLLEQDRNPDGRHPDGVIPAGSTTELWKKDKNGVGFLTTACAPSKDAPLLQPTHIEAWVQTKPEPSVQPELAPFLHGIPDPNHPERPEVSLVWRYDNTEAALKLVRPLAAEMLSVPLAAARRWLKGLDEFAIADTGAPDKDKNETDKELNKPDVKPLADKVTVWRYRSQSSAYESKKISVQEINPNDVLIIPPAWGGITDDTWDPSPPEAEGPKDAIGNTIKDLGDAAQHAYKRQVTLRLDRRLINQWPSSLLLPSLPNPSEETDTEGTDKERIKIWLLEAQRALEVWMSDREPGTAQLRWLVDVLKRLTSNSWRVKTVKAADSTKNGDSYYVLQSGIDPDDDQCPQTDSGASLFDHLKGVGDKAANFAERLGLPKKLVADLRLAGELHDLGKVDARFQMQMVGQDSFKFAGLKEPLAKSIPGVKTSPKDSPTVRHEISSVALVQSNEDVLSLANDKDLVLYLVGTHHGHGRPIPVIRPDDDPQPLAISYMSRGADLPMAATTDLAHTTLAVEMAERFWRLHRKYGHHGIAWLEAILRLADHRVSAEEKEGRDKK